MTPVHAIDLGNKVQSVLVTCVPRVADQDQRPVECGWAQKRTINAGDAATGETGAALDAIEGGVDGLSFVRVWLDQRRLVQGVDWLKLGSDTSPLIPERCCVHNQITNHRIPREGTDMKRFRVRLHNRLAGQDRTSVDPNRACSKHGHTARKPEPNRCIMFTLNREQDVQHRHRCEPVHAELGLVLRITS